MADAILLRDQTLSEAAHLRIPWKQLVKAFEILEQMSFAGYDLWLDDWLYYGQKVIPQDFHALRGRIRPCSEQVESAHKAGFRKISVVYEQHVNTGLTENLARVLRTANNLNLKTAVEIRNASALSSPEILELFASLAAFEVQSFIYCDADGNLDPFITSAVFEKFLQSADWPLEFHAHNQYGLATANCLAAIQAGVKIVNASVAGIGIGGHAAHEEIVMATRRAVPSSFARMPKLAEPCHAILDCIGIKTPLTKAIIGLDIFAHESGIHTAGVLKRPELYEAFSPEEVGLSRRLVIGKHSGKTSLEEKLKQENMVLDAIQSERLLAKVRQVAVEQKSPLTDGQLKKLYQDCVMKQAEGF